MKIAGILFFTFFAVYVMYKANPSVSASYDAPPKGLQPLMDNANNKIGLQVGHPEQIELTLKKYGKLQQEELVQLIDSQSLTLFQASNALMMLGNSYIQEGNVSKGLPLMVVAAEEYHNPFAMVALARAYFHGFEKETGETTTEFIRDLEKAYYFINRSFQTAGVIHEKMGQKFALDKCVAMGLGLLDSYQLGKIKAEFNHSEFDTQIGRQIQTDLEAFGNMYKIK